MREGGREGGREEGREGATKRQYVINNEDIDCTKKAEEASLNH